MTQEPNTQLKTEMSSTSTPPSKFSATQYIGADFDDMFPQSANAESPTQEKVDQVEPTTRQDDEFSIRYYPSDEDEDDANEGPGASQPALTQELQTHTAGNRTEEAQSSKQGYMGFFEYYNARYGADMKAQAGDTSEGQFILYAFDTILILYSVGVGKGKGKGGYWSKASVKMDSSAIMEATGTATARGFVRWTAANAGAVAGACFCEGGSGIPFVFFARGFLRLPMERSERGLSLVGELAEPPIPAWTKLSLSAWSCMAAG